MSCGLVLESRRSGTRPAIPQLHGRGRVSRSGSQQAAQDTFGASVIDVFSSAEGGSSPSNALLAAFITSRARSSLPEILRSDGKPAAPGETGELVVTPLYSYATPIIRYRTGDFVEVGPPCPLWALPADHRANRGPVNTCSVSRTEHAPFRRLTALRSAKTLAP